MDPAAFATYQPPQGSGGGLFRPSSSPFNGGSGGGDHRRGPNSHHMRNIQNSNSGSNMMSSNGGSIPQGSKLATYMNRGGGGGQSNFNNGGNSNPNNLAQMTADLNNLGLDPNTMKKLSMSGLREFIPPSTGGSSVNSVTSSMNMRSTDNSGSNSPYQQQQQPNFVQNPSSVSGISTASRLQPPPPQQPPTSTMGSYISSPRGSPTPSSVGSSVNQAGDNGAGGPPGDPNSISAYSDGGTTYFYNPDEVPPGMSGDAMMSNNGMAGVPHQGQVMIPNYSVFSGTPSHIVNMKTRSSIPTYLQENELRMDILKRQQICHAQIDPESGSHLPTSVDNFTQLCPLEPPPPSPLHKSQTFGYVTSVYKATNTKNGQYVALRRIHGFRLVNTKCMVLVDQWKKLQHGNLVALRQVFTTKSFNDHSMVFVYDFYAGAETLFSRHFSGSNQMSGNGGQFMDPYSGGPDPNARSFNPGKMLRQQAVVSQSVLLPESLIWTYVIQMTSALRHIHLAGLACRTLDPTKILIINKTRLLLNCCGIFDVLTFDPTSSNPMAAMAHYQQEDLIALGKIVLALACNSFLAIQRENLQTSMEVVTSTYSSDMRNLIMYLLTNPTRLKTVNDLMPMIGNVNFYQNNCV